MELPGGVANIVQRMKRYAVVGWRVGDVQTLRPDMTDEQAAEFLERNIRRIEDRMVEAGWEAIQHLLFEEGL